MRPGTMVLLAVLLVGLSACVKRKSDKRVADFEKYIIEQAEKRAYSKSTEEDKINFITSRYNHGEEFDNWIDDLKKWQKKTLDDLYDYCKVIHQLDREVGRELSFEEAVKIVMACPDTSPNPDDVVWLQRNINAVNALSEELIGWEEAQKWEKRMKKEGKKIELNKELIN
ncbi:MAG: hypothetical protein K2L89_06670 [Muribaculaceae bacterium]|nr:hypothetical protein [Muribaculaceae bacterium]